MPNTTPAHTTPAHTTSTTPARTTPAHTTSTTPAHTTSTTPAHTTSTTPAHTTSTTPATTTPASTREIFLAVFSNPGPAHWAIFVPTTGSTTKGTLIHVTGSPAVGFTLEFKRNYDFTTTQRRYRIISLGHIDSKYIRDSSSTQESTDSTARDQLQMQAISVVPPGRSATPLAQGNLNCQNWIIDYVAHLVQMHMLQASAQQVVSSAPKTL